MGKADSFRLASCDPLLNPCSAHSNDNTWRWYRWTVEWKVKLFHFKLFFNLAILFNFLYCPILLYKNISIHSYRCKIDSIFIRFLKTVYPWCIAKKWHPPKHVNMKINHIFLKYSFLAMFHMTNNMGMYDVNWFTFPVFSLGLYPNNVGELVGG